MQWTGLGWRKRKIEGGEGGREIESGERERWRGREREGRGERDRDGGGERETERAA